MLTQREQRQAAREFAVKCNMYYTKNYCENEKESVSLDNLGRICEYFQCDIGDIIEYKCEVKSELYRI